MTSNLGRGFVHALIDAIFGEHVTSLPATCDGIVHLHVGDPGEDLNENIEPESERPATFTVDEDLQGFVHIADPNWVCDGTGAASLSFTPNTGGVTFPITLNCGRALVQSDDHLHVSADVSFSVKGLIA